MSSKMVLVRQKSAALFLSWAAIHGASVSRGVVQRLGKKADPKWLIDAMAKAVEESRDKMVKAARVNDLKVSRDRTPRRARDEAAPRVLKIMGRMKVAIELGHGVEGLAEIGLEESLPRDPLAVEGRAKQVMEAVGTRGFKLPREVASGVDVNLADFVTELKPALAELSASLEEVNAEKTGTESTQKAKNDALDDFSATFAGAVNTVAGLARVARLDDLAEKLPALTWTRRLASAAEEVDEAETPADA